MIYMGWCLRTYWETMYTLVLYDMIFCMKSRVYINGINMSILKDMYHEWHWNFPKIGIEIDSLIWNKSKIQKFCALTLLSSVSFTSLFV